MSPSASGSPAPGDRREVTVLFTDLAGFTAFSEASGEEAAYLLMQQILPLMVAAVEKFNGTMSSFTGDGIMAIFGGSENGPLNACRAALAIQDAVAEAAGRIETQFAIKPQMRIGINSGPAIVAPSYGAKDANITALGDTVNLASRLQALAPLGGTVLSESTHDLVNGIVTSHYLGEQSVKGKAKPQKIYQLMGINQSASRFGLSVSHGLKKFVGRSDEMEIATNAMRRRRNHVQIIDIAGEAGIGKSRLVYEITKKIEADRYTALICRATPDTQQTAFHIFIEMIRLIFKISLGESRKAIIRKVEEGLTVLELASQENIHLIINLLGLGSNRDNAIVVDGAVVGAQVSALLRMLLAARCRLLDTVLIVEDLHWADQSSEILLEEIIQHDRNYPLVILQTRRTAYTPRWIDQPSVTTILLKPLSSKDIEDLACARLGATALPGALAAMLAERAEGNALFAEEILSYLVDRNSITVSDGTVVVTDNASASGLPRSILTLLTARIDNLSSTSRLILQGGAVIGRRFSPELLQLVIQSDDPNPILDELVRLDILSRNTDTEEYVFKHALVQDAIYNSLLQDRKLQLHQRVADEIERRSGNRIIEVAETLAYHYARTSDFTKSFKYLALAGGKCLDIFAVEDADFFLTRALDLVESSRYHADDVALSSVVVDLVLTCHHKSDFGRLIDLAQTYIARLEKHGETPNLAKIIALYGIARGSQGDLAAWDAMSRRALAIGVGIGDLQARAWGVVGIYAASSMLCPSPLSKAQADGLEALRISIESGSNFLIDFTHFHIGLDMQARGLTGEARHWALRLISSGTERGDRRAHGLANCMLSWLALFENQFEDALAYAQECIHISVTPWDKTLGEMLRAVAMMLRGDVKEGFEGLLRARDLAEHRGWLIGKTVSNGFVGIGLALQGRLAEAIAHLKSAIAAGEAQNSALTSITDRLALAEIYLSILNGGRGVSIGNMLRGIGTIIAVKSVGIREIRRSMKKCLEYTHLEQSGVIVARIKFVLARTCIMKRDFSSAKALLEESRAAAIANDSGFLQSQIDLALTQMAAP